jgi:hypothetical protein
MNSDEILSKILKFVQYSKIDEILRLKEVEKKILEKLKNL